MWLCCEGPAICIYKCSAIKLMAIEFSKWTARGMLVGTEEAGLALKTETETAVRHVHANCLSERENKETTERKTRTEIAKRITLHRTGLRRASISAAGKFVPCILYAVVARTNPAHASGEAARLQSETHTQSSWLGINRHRHRDRDSRSSAEAADLWQHCAARIPPFLSSCISSCISTHHEWLQCSMLPAHQGS